MKDGTVLFRIVQQKLVNGHICLFGIENKLYLSFIILFQQNIFLLPIVILQEYIYPTFVKTSYVYPLPVKTSVPALIERKN